MRLHLTLLVSIVLLVGASSSALAGEPPPPDALRNGNVKRIVAQYLKESEAYLKDLTDEFRQPDEDSERYALERCADMRDEMRVTWERIEKLLGKRIPFSLHEWKKTEEETWRRVAEDGIEMLRVVARLEASTKTLESLQKEHVERARVIGGRARRLAAATDDLEKADKPIADLNHLATQLKSADKALENIDEALDLIQDNFQLLRYVPGTFKRATEARKVVQKLCYTLRGDVRDAYLSTKHNIELFKKMVGKMRDTRIDLDSSGLYYTYEKRWKEQLLPNFERYTRAVAKYEKESERALQSLVDILVGGGGQFLGIPASGRLFRIMVTPLGKDWRWHHELDEQFAAWWRTWISLRKVMGSRLKAVLEEAYEKEQSLHRKSDDEVGRITRAWEKAVQKRRKQRERDVKPIEDAIEQLIDIRGTDREPASAERDLAQLIDRRRAINEQYDVDVAELTGKRDGEIELIEAERKKALADLEAFEDRIELQRVLLEK